MNRFTVLQESLILQHTKLKNKGVENLKFYELRLACSLVLKCNVTFYKL